VILDGEKSVYSFVYRLSYDIATLKWVGGTLRGPGGSGDESGSPSNLVPGSFLFIFRGMKKVDPGNKVAPPPTRANEKESTIITLFL